MRCSVSTEGQTEGWRSYLAHEHTANRAGMCLHYHVSNHNTSSTHGVVLDPHASEPSRLPVYAKHCEVQIPQSTLTGVTSEIN